MSAFAVAVASHSVQPAEEKVTLPQLRKTAHRKRRSGGGEKDDATTAAAGEVCGASEDAVMQAEVAQLAEQLVGRLYAYWQLKRASRHGVPLLRRLLASASSSAPLPAHTAGEEAAAQHGVIGNTDNNNNNNAEIADKEERVEQQQVEVEEQTVTQSQEIGAIIGEEAEHEQQQVAQCGAQISFKRKIEFWQKLRQDLEKVRLLAELVRKKEKIKLFQFRVFEEMVEWEMQPDVCVMRRLLAQLEDFLEANQMRPTQQQAHSEGGEEPDLASIAQRVSQHAYLEFEQFEEDVRLAMDSAKLSCAADSRQFQTALRLQSLANQLFQEVREGGALREMFPAPIKSPDSLHPAEEAANQEVGATGGSRPITAASATSVCVSSPRQLKQSKISAHFSPLLRNKAAPAERTTATGASSLAGTARKKRRNQSDQSELDKTEECRLENQSERESENHSEVQTREQMKKRRRIASPSPNKQQQEEMQHKDDATNAIGPIGTSKREQKLEKRSRASGRRRSTEQNGAGGQSERRSSSSSSSSSVYACARSPARSSPVQNATASNSPTNSPDKLTLKQEKHYPIKQKATKFFHEKEGREMQDDRDEDDDGEETDRLVAADEEESELDKVPDKTQPENSSLSPRTPHPTQLLRFAPLDLVWAKCRGSPWYPGLLIDPTMQKDVELCNGAVIPRPPESVLSAAPTHAPPHTSSGGDSNTSHNTSHTGTEGEAHHLVLFFDATRTWTWLPGCKLAPLGSDWKLDNDKLTLSKKSRMKNSVRKAYQEAINHVNSLAASAPPPSSSLHHNVEAEATLVTSPTHTNTHASSLACLDDSAAETTEEHSNVPPE